MAGDPREDLRTRFNAAPTGPLDALVRRFGALAHMLAALFLYAIAASAVGVALAPAFWLFDLLSRWAEGWTGPAHWLALGVGAGVSIHVAGFALLAVVPAYNFLLPTRSRPFKGGYFSLAAVPWCLHNGLFYLVRYTVLPYVTLTPFGLWFLRAMGMRLGKRVFVNTEFISDPRLITLGDDVVVGGSVHLFAHYGGGGHLVVAPVRVGARATIGQKATVMGDVEIGEDATILPHSVLLPGSRVGAGETWGGVPAMRLADEELQRVKAAIRRPASRSYSASEP